MKKLALLTMLGLGLVACAPTMQAHPTQAQPTQAQPTQAQPAASDSLHQGKATPEGGAIYDHRGRRPNMGIDGSNRNLLAVVRPDVGRGGTYDNAADIKLEVAVRSDGYLTIQRLDKDSAAQTLLRDYAVEAGNLTVRLPRAAFTEAGLQRLRVSFSQPRPATDIVLGGAKVGGELRPTEIGKRLTPQRAAVVRDVQETFFYIQEQEK